MVLILRGHLLMELLLNDIVHTFQNKGMPKKMIRAIQNAYMIQKADVLYEHKIIEDRQHNPLTAQNSIRNRFAHLPLKTELTPLTS